MEFPYSAAHAPSAFDRLDPQQLVIFLRDPRNYPSKQAVSQYACRNDIREVVTRAKKLKLVESRAAFDKMGITWRLRTNGRINGTFRASACAFVNAKLRDVFWPLFGLPPEHLRLFSFALLAVPRTKLFALYRAAHSFVHNLPSLPLTPGSFDARAYRCKMPRADRGPQAEQWSPSMPPETPAELPGEGVDPAPEVWIVQPQAIRRNRRQSALAEAVASSGRGLSPALTNDQVEDRDARTSIEPSASPQSASTEAVASSTRGLSPALTNDQVEDRAAETGMETSASRKRLQKWKKFKKRKSRKVRDRRLARRKAKADDGKVLKGLHDQLSKQAEVMRDIQCSLQARERGFAKASDVTPTELRRQANMRRVFEKQYEHAVIIEDSPEPDLLLSRTPIPEKTSTKSPASALACSSDAGKSTRAVSVSKSGSSRDECSLPNERGRVLGANGFKHISVDSRTHARYFASSTSTSAEAFDISASAIGRQDAPDRLEGSRPASSQGRAASKQPFAQDDSVTSLQSSRKRRGFIARGAEDGPGDCGKSPGKRRRALSRASGSESLTPNSGPAPSSEQQRVPLQPHMKLDTDVGLFAQRYLKDPFAFWLAAAFHDKFPPSVATWMTKITVKRYPTPIDLCAAPLDDLVHLLRSQADAVFLEQKILSFASFYKHRTPQSGILKAIGGVGQYPQKLKGESQIENLRRIGYRTFGRLKFPAIEIGEVPGLTAHRLDLWRVFYSDKFRGLAEDHLGNGSEPGYEPEWTRVVPIDLRLRAYVRWLWLDLEDRDFDHVTGRTTSASPESRSRRAHVQTLRHPNNIMQALLEHEHEVEQDAMQKQMEEDARAEAAQRQRDSDLLYSIHGPSIERNRALALRNRPERPTLVPARSPIKARLTQYAELLNHTRPYSRIPDGHRRVRSASATASVAQPMESIEQSATTPELELSHASPTPSPASSRRPQNPRRRMSMPFSNASNQMNRASDLASDIKVAQQENPSTTLAATAQVHHSQSPATPLLTDTAPASASTKSRGQRRGRPASSTFWVPPPLDPPMTAFRSPFTVPPPVSPTPSDAGLSAPGGFRSINGGGESFLESPLRSTGHVRQTTVERSAAGGHYPRFRNRRE